MRGVNKVILIGTLGSDPDLRYTQSGQAVCTLSLATNESWGQGDDRQERTEWHRVIIWGRKGEVAKEYLAKGRPVYIEGRLQTRKWTDKNNVDRYTTEVIAREMQFIDSKRGGGGGGSGQPPFPGDNDFGGSGGGGQEDDDDIPF